METGIDFSLDAITGAQAKAAGYSFVCRYLASSTGKRITAAQVADYQANDLGIVLVFEDYANQALDGFGQGVADANEALAQANALGFPADRPIYFAVDFDEADTPLQNSEIYTYLDGAATILGKNRVGVYGGYYVLVRCMQNGHAPWGWQTIAWSGGQVYSGAHLYQNGNSAFGGGADVNQALKKDFGQWAKGGIVDQVATYQDAVDMSQTVLLRAEPMSQAEWNQYHAAAKRTLYQLYKDWASSDEAKAARFKSWDYDKEVAKLTDVEKQLAACQNQPAPAPSPSPDPTPSPTPSPSAPVSIWQQIINFFTGK